MPDHPASTVFIATPDPSLLTTAQIQRELGSLRDLLETRLNLTDRNNDQRFQSVEGRQERQYAEADLRYQQRHDANSVALQAASVAAEKAIAAALVSAEKAVQSALGAAKEAVQKAELSNEKRFEAVNEFRATLSDQQSKLMPRTEAEARLAALAEKVTDVSNNVVRREGNTTGQSTSQASMIAIAALALSVAMAGVTIFSGRGGSPAAEVRVSPPATITAPH